MNHAKYQLSAFSLAAIILVTLGLGVMIGLLSRPVDEQLEPLVTSVSPPQRRAQESEGLGLGSAEIEPEYRRLAREAEALVARGDYATAIDRLIEADLAAVNPTTVAWVGRRLEKTIEAYVTTLRNDDRDDLIDDVYQQLTFAMPEKAVFYLRLAVHRVQSGMPERALPVLSHIENHQQYGARARELINSIAQAQSLAALISLPLQKVGDQYLVRAFIDGQFEVTLLIDTGASMTILAPSVLSELGYRLDGEQTNFSTANGNVTAPLVRIEQIALGEAIVEPITVGALELGRAGQVFDGLLGMNFLSRFEFALDQETALLHLKARAQP